MPVNNYTLALSSRINGKKKVREFPDPSRDVTIKLSLGGNNDVITDLFLPRGSLFSDIPAGDGKLVNLFLRCVLSVYGFPHGLMNYQNAKAKAYVNFS
jgi:hypothetical protein